MDFDYTKPRKVLRGPISFFDGSCTLEFLEAEPDADCTTLLRATYKASHPLLKKGKSHPQAPPLHVHFHQIETFKVIQGAVGLTIGYDQKEMILTPENTPFSIDQMIPHAPYPHPELSGANGQDTVAILRAHPENVPGGETLDDVFFEHLFRHLDERWRDKRAPDLFQLLLSQHESASANVILPGWGFLGSLRWWIPWKVQAGVAFIARRLGYTPLIQKYLKDQ